jgi:nuclear pore complex protein Nup155
LRLFEETAAALDIENLKDTIAEYRGLQYYPGAVQLALTVAQEADRGNQALVYLHEGPPTTVCYDSFRGIGRDLPSETL